MPKGYKQLTLEKRCHISALLKTGVKKAAIAREVGTSKNTISEELRRNQTKHGYNPYVAQQKAASRRVSAGNVRKKKKLGIKVWIADLIRMAQWSPEQAAGWVKKHVYISISHTSIYAYFRTDRKNGGTLYKHLRNRGKKQNKQYKKSAGKRLIPGRIGIEHRPEEANMKIRIGDFEADTIIGVGHRCAILSAVDRKTKYCKLCLLRNMTAKEASNAMVEMLEPIKDAVITITTDNGKEFADHKKISTLLGAHWFFANPYSSGERGLNELTNRFVRQYYPKKHDFAKITKGELQRIEDLLNNRPRKCLNFQTPNEVFLRSRSS